jgi:hypothetical protein
MNWDKARRRTKGIPVSPVQVAADRHIAAEKSKSTDKHGRAAADVAPLETPICPTCGNVARLSDGKFGIKAECCGLWSWGLKSLVSRETHAARIAAHTAFDALWKSGRIERRDAYAKLAELMGMPRAECHMSLMTVEQATRARRLVTDGAIVADPPPPLPRTTRTHPAHRRNKQREVFITVGADCPWNTTPGVRQSHHFESVEAAHRAGFTAVRA